MEVYGLQIESLLKDLGEFEHCLLPQVYVDINEILMQQTKALGSLRSHVKSSIIRERMGHPGSLALGLNQYEENVVGGTKNVTRFTIQRL